MDTITRIAARGDGVTANGKHVSGAAPGDQIAADGSIIHGPHHVAPPCHHFGKCGGCELQHCDNDVLAQFVSDRVAHVAAAQEIEIEELLPAHLSPPKSRRRATLHARRAGKKTILGFKEARSHRIIDLRECHILHPRLWALINPLRRLLGALNANNADIELTVIDQGVDCSIRGLHPEGLEQIEAATDFARDHALARLSFDAGYGAETVWEPEPATITLDQQTVPFPHGSFLQPTLDGQAKLTALAREWLTGVEAIADLFSGLGTFAFALVNPSRKIMAVEASRDAVLACQTAANRAGLPIKALHRDLFRNPLQPNELSHFDAILLDPPRAGAKEQVTALAESEVERIVYVSCNPSSWARDAKTLCDAGFYVERVKPVGQFTWSTHVELISLLSR